jgi:hypothetical protein
LIPSAAWTDDFGSEVSHVWIDGKVMKDPGDIDGDGIAVIPLKILATVYQCSPGPFEVNNYKALFTVARRFMTMHIMHSVTVKLFMVFHRVFSACRKRPFVAVAIVEVMIYVAVEMIRPVIPGPGADKYAT